ncbi:MAG: ferritin [Anaerolineae bacterium]|nr:ferritin [Anaerolineae bacterium]
MLSDKLQQAMNDQIKNELYSAYLYLSMAAWAEAQNLPGFAHWMKAQAQEELGHAMKFFGFIHERGGRVTLQAIDQPPADFAGPTDLFATTLAHEKQVTAMIHNLYKMAREEGDYASEIFLQWFVTEQVEEEQSAEQILELLKMAGEKGQALIMADRYLAQRGG